MNKSLKRLNSSIAGEVGKKGEGWYKSHLWITLWMWWCTFVSIRKWDMFKAICAAVEQFKTTEIFVYPKFVAWSRLQELNALSTWWRWLHWTHVKHVCISTMWKNARVVPVQIVHKICQFDIILYSIWSYIYKDLSRVAAHRNRSSSILFHALVLQLFVNLYI